MHAIQAFQCLHLLCFLGSMACSSHREKRVIFMVLFAGCHNGAAWEMKVARRQPKTTSSGSTPRKPATGQTRAAKLMQHKQNKPTVIARNTHMQTRGAKQKQNVCVHVVSSLLVLCPSWLLLSIENTAQNNQRTSTETMQETPHKGINGQKRTHAHTRTHTHGKMRLPLLSQIGEPVGPPDAS